MFGNLLNNAAKYSEDGGTISVEAQREGLEAIVAVSDTGEGLDLEQLPQLFKMFYRGSHTARRNQSGLGIGLPLSRRLVEMHGGRISAESDGPGRGSRFTVRLPLNPAQQVAPAAKEAKRPEVAPMTILVVDDNYDAAESMCMLLKVIGVEVRVAHDGPQALAAYEACRPAAPRTSLVALAGWGQDEDKKRVRDAGFDHHLVKPADLAHCSR